jgi:hypothetical protein
MSELKKTHTDGDVQVIQQTACRYLDDMPSRQHRLFAELERVVGTGCPANRYHLRAANRPVGRLAPGNPSQLGTGSGDRGPERPPMSVCSFRMSPFPLKTANPSLGFSDGIQWQGGNHKLYTSFISELPHALHLGELWFRQFQNKPDPLRGRT